MQVYDYWPLWEPNETEESPLEVVGRSPLTPKLFPLFIILSSFDWEYVVCTLNSTLAVHQVYTCTVCIVCIRTGHEYVRKKYEFIHNWYECK